MSNTSQIRITVERLENNDLELPSYATPHSAGLDMRACLTRPCKTATKVDFKLNGTSRVPPAAILPSECNKPVLIIAQRETILIPLGFKIYAPKHYIQLQIRSSIALRGLTLANGSGIIDEDYTGEVFAMCYNYGTVSVHIQHGEKIVQALLKPSLSGLLEEGALSDTNRGDGGFGSTGTGLQPK